MLLWAVLSVATAIAAAERIFAGLDEINSRKEWESFADSQLLMDPDSAETEREVVEV